jgi:hypothetical protein
MTQNNLVGKTILLVEDQFTILLDLKDALEEAGGRVLLGSQHVEHPELSAAVLDRAEPTVADRLTERGLPFVFYTGRQSNEFARWPHVESTHFGCVRSPTLVMEPTNLCQ